MRNFGIRYDCEYAWIPNSSLDVFLKVDKEDRVYGKEIYEFIPKDYIIYGGEV